MLSGMRCSRNSVGPNTKTSTSNAIDRTELALLMRCIPFCTPTNTEMAVMSPMTTMTPIFSSRLDSIPKSELTPELNCIEANPNEVARPRIVVMMASHSITRPPPRRICFGRMSWHEPRNEPLCPRLNRA